VALALYAEIRSRLRDELGLEPDRELRDAQLRVLRQRVVPGRLRPPPRLTSFTLPRTVDDFTGRTDEMSLLTSPTATVRCIDGMPGVGKTTLAVELAHHLAPHYPDAQLLVDLQAHSGPPLAPRDALLRLLGGLGIELPRTPDLPSCVDLWRRWTAGHRALLVLDDAASAEQVRPLLPTGSGCLVVVTSRTRLPGLESSHRLSLDVLQLDQAFTLVSRIVGDSRATGQRDAVEEVARLCGYLPLAVRIAASRLRDRPAWSADHLARQLKNGLTELKTGDRSVEAAFSLSYAQLTTAQQRFFRCLGVFPGVEIDEYAAAALADLRPAAAADLLEQLVDVHLLEQPRQSRYRFHDLVRQHAQQTARSVDPAADRAEALRRVVDYYLQVADQAATLIEPHRQRFEPEQAKPAQLPDLLNAAGATSWLEAERPNLTATVTIAAERGWHQVTWQLAQCLWRYYLVRGHLLDWLETHEKALNSARLIGDPIAEAETLKNLGIAYLRLGRFDEAVAVHEQALSLDVSSQDQVGAAKTHNNLGFVLSTSGSLDQALSHHQEAAKLYRIVSDPSGEGRALVGLGNALHRLGEYETALGHYRRATALTRTADDAWGETLAAAGAGFSLLRKGRVAPAQDEFRAAYDLAKAHADRGGECLALVGLGLVHLREGRDDEARTHLQAGLWIADEAGEIWGGELAREAMLHLADGVTVNQLEPRNAG
jgi:tetratricopeptide (TPR) repeat protein